MLKHIEVNREDYTINYTIYWKKILILLQKHPIELRFPALDEAGIETTSISDNDKQKLVDIAKKIGMLEEIEKKVQKHNLSTMTDSEVPLYKAGIAKVALRQLFSYLEKLQYVQSVKGKRYVGSAYFNTWELTADGIDVALRLQEHEASQDRHRQSQWISKTALILSVIAALFTATSLCINYLRYEAYIENNTCNISSTMKHQKSMKIKTN